ncbi:MAG TPA: hypothetical protein VFQ20_02795 [Burkholderiaceae bacterium]|nr:hypothetical protein [Burkholderiaceae bacterium]
MHPTAPAWKRWLDWVAQPQVAGAFGTLAIATVLGVMWATREPPSVVDEPVAVEAPRAVVEQDAARPASAAQAGNAAVPAAASPRAAPAPKRDAARRSEAAAPEARADLLAEKKAKAAPPAPAAAPLAAPTAPTQAMKENAPVAGGLADSAMAGRLRAAPAAPSPEQLLARIDALLSPWPEHVVWRSAGRSWSHQAPQAESWAKFKRDTGGTWEAQTRARPPQPPWLRLMSGAAVEVATIHLVGDGVLLCGGEEQACWRAPVSAAQREAWQAEVARW